MKINSGRETGWTLYFLIEANEGFPGGYRKRTFLSPYSDRRGKQGEGSIAVEPVAVAFG